VTYRIEFATSAAKEFRALDQVIKRRVTSAIESLLQEPHSTNVRKLRGHQNLYRIRVGAYRIVHEIDDQAKLI
jgi:mRNA interferase RelE/StbE